MKVAIKAGAEIDVLTPAEHAESIARLEDRLQRLLRQIPLIRTLEGSVDLDAAGLGVMRLALPPVADAWDVRRLNVTYNDAGAASVAGIVTAYRGDNINPMNYFDRNLDTIPVGNLPFVRFYGSRQVTLRQDEPILLVISGGTASARVFASAQVLQADLAEISQAGLS